MKNVHDFARCQQTKNLMLYRDSTSATGLLTDDGDSDDDHDDDDDDDGDDGHDDDDDDGGHNVDGGGGGGDDEDTAADQIHECTDGRLSMVIMLLRLLLILC